MKYNKGFTLIELLAVIVILSLIVLVTSTAVTKTVKDSKKTLYNTQIAAIKGAAEQYGSENIEMLPEATKDNPVVERNILLSDIIKSGILEEVNNPITNKPFTDEDIQIKVTATYSLEYDKTIYKYEVIEK